MKKIHKIKSLEQVKLLSEPLKLRLIQSFSESPKTPKQVAIELNENLTKLYRHVDALFAAGLLEIVSEKQKRGTVERTFQSIAERFEADHSLFTKEQIEASEQAVKETLRAGEQEILESLLQAEHDNEDILQPTVARLRLCASNERLMELNKLLMEWVDAVQQEDQKSAPQAIEAGALIAFYPIAK